MLEREDFDETPAEKFLAFSRKNCPKFASYTNYGMEDVGKTNALLHSSKPKDEQVTKQDATGSESFFLILQRN